MKTKPSFVTLKNGTRIAYHKITAQDNKNSVPALPGIVFIHGFKSDMQGTKALGLEAHCQQQGIGFIRFDCSGHGQSSGDFLQGTIGGWAEDLLGVLDTLTEGPQILVGSSMGGWLMLLAALKRPRRIAGLVGVAAAPDFTEYLLWDKLRKEEQQTILSEGVYYLPSDYCNDPQADPEPYPITRILIEEARKHLLLHQKIPIACPVRLIHGMRDDDVPYETALRLASQLETENLEIILSKTGCHRMSEPEDVALVVRTVEQLLQQTVLH